jgi:hypothetical protein
LLLAACCLLLAACCLLLVACRLLPAACFLLLAACCWLLIIRYLLCSLGTYRQLADLHAGKQYKAWKAIRDKLVELTEANPTPKGGKEASTGGK